MSAESDYFMRMDSSPYKGEWIAIHGESVVAHSESFKEVHRQDCIQFLSGFFGKTCKYRLIKRCKICIVVMKGRFRLMSDDMRARTADRRKENRRTIRRRAAVKACGACFINVMTEYFKYSNL